MDSWTASSPKVSEWTKAAPNWDQSILLQSTQIFPAYRCLVFTFKMSARVGQSDDCTLHLNFAELRTETMGPIFVFPIWASGTVVDTG